MQPKQSIAPGPHKDEHDYRWIAVRRGAWCAVLHVYRFKTPRSFLWPHCRGTNPTRTRWCCASRQSWTSCSTTLHSKAWSQRTAQLICGISTLTKGRPLEGSRVRCRRLHAIHPCRCRLVLRSAWHGSTCCHDRKTSMLLCLPLRCVSRPHITWINSCFDRRKARSHGAYVSLECTYVCLAYDVRTT